MKNYSSLLLIFVLLFSFYSCSNKTNPQKELFPEDTLPGAVIVAQYEDSTPAVVQIFALDEAGNITSELTREIQYYHGHKKYIDCSYSMLQADSALMNVKDGPAYAYFQNGNVQTEAFYVKGKEHGDYNLYYENGKPFVLGHYDMGVRTGEWKFYYENGQLCKSGEYTVGNCSGIWKLYDEKGVLLDEVTADETTFCCGDCPKCKNLKH